MRTESATALFRAHAIARLRGDTAEADRLADRIEAGQRVTHVLFLLSLLTQVVIEEYGSRPDPTDLAAVTKRLHDKHFAADANFNALHAEAMIRAVCGESVLLTEIPHADQPAYLWAMLGELVEPDCTDAELAELFDLAEATGLECLTEAFEATIRDHPRRTVREEAPPEPTVSDGPAAEPGTARPFATEPGTTDPGTTEAPGEPTAAEASEGESA